MNTNLYKNAEGYTDPTAAATLSRREPLDVWAYMNGECLIIKNHGTFSTILMLGREKKYPSDVKIETENEVFYTNPRKLTWGHHQKMYGYIGSVSVADFNSVMDAVEEELSVTLMREEKTDWQATAMQGLAEIEKEVDGLRQEKDKLQKERDFFLARMTELETLHASAVDRVNRVTFAKLKVVNQLELLQGMVGSVLAHFQVDTEE